MTLRLYATCENLCYAKMVDDNGQITDRDGAVPIVAFLNSNKQVLEIDAKTGQILNWLIPPDKEIQEFID